MIYPKNFNLEKTSLWSFPERGKWATHSGNYRGNWSPFVPRNLILGYSNENDWVLDQFLGSGTTLVEAKLLNRNAIGVDINPDAIDISKKNMDFISEKNPKIVIKKGDARELFFIKNNSIDLICTHPPYSDIIRYSNNSNRDISHLSLKEFINEISIVALESYRVLKNGKFCAVMMGDIRKRGNVIPLGFQVMDCFLKAGFNSKEIIIKEQHNCKSSNHWNEKKKNFLMLAHEYIFVFTK